MERQQQYVGIDLHRRRSVIVRKTSTGEPIETVQIDNDPDVLAAELRKAGEHPKVLLEATYGWYWAADVLQAEGANVHLAQPLGNNWGHRRVKNDERDATDLIDLLRLGRLAEAWTAPPEVREVREHVRYRAKLVHLRGALKSQVHAILAKEGVAVPMSDLFGKHGGQLLDDVALATAFRVRVDSLRELIDRVDLELAMVEECAQRALDGDPGYRAIQRIPGVGPVLAGVFVAEIGDVTRFRSPSHLTSWAGLTPMHRESDSRSVATTSPSKARASCAGPPAAVIRQRGHTVVQAHHRRVAERRGSQIERVAAARKLLVPVYYGLRDGEIRCLARAG